MVPQQLRQDALEQVESTCAEHLQAIVLEQKKDMAGCQAACQA